MAQTIQNRKSKIPNRSFPLDLMLRVLALAGAKLLQLDLGRPAGHLDLGPVVQVAA
jgi:hypothetical protein